MAADINIKELFLGKYEAVGADKFYNFLIEYAENRILDTNKNGLSPELELMGYHDKFIALFRKEHNPTFLELSRLFRRAAHKVYRIMLKNGSIEQSEKFLNTVE
jgi:hypothetical protein